MRAALGSSVLALTAILAVAQAATAQPEGSTLKVAAASSLSEAFTGLGAGARYSFAGSDQLAAQIRAGAPYDLVASASPEHTQSLFRDGLVERPVAFAANRLVVIVPRSNPRRIKTPADLGRPDTAVVLAAPSVPVGAYARQALTRLGLMQSVLANLVSNEPDVKGVVGKVALGQADAGIVYATDARAVATRVRVIALPSRAQPRIRYEIAVVTRSSRKAAARAFVARLLSPAGVRALRAAGFISLQPVTRG